MDEAIRLTSLLNHLKINASQFAKKTGIPQGSVSAITLGKKRITIEILHSIIKTYPTVNIDWLMKGVGEPFLEILEETGVDSNEPLVDYTAIKSTLGKLADGLPDEDKMKITISENLRLISKRWKMTQPEMLELLGGSVGRGGASTYFRGDTLPRLPILFRLERFTGWPLVVLATRALEFDQVPPAPLVDAPVEPSRISAAEAEELKGELHRLR